MRNGTYFGIDFGTTNTAIVAVLVEGSNAKILNLGENGDYPFSSMVAIPKNGGDWLFGRDVKYRRLELEDEYYIITSIKTFLNAGKEIVVGDNRYAPIEITAQFLRYVKDYIKGNHALDITEATFAFPVDFKPEGRTALAEAAKKVGIKVNGFISESTAAYIANREQSRAYSKVMVVDWGGGTIDVSILEVEGDNLFEVAVMGEQIGGDDIDKMLAESIHSKLASEKGLSINFSDMDLRHRDMLIAKSEQAKIYFEAEDEADVTLLNYGAIGTKVTNIDYERFCDIIAPTINDVIRVIEKAMKNGNVTISRIDAVIMVGGSSDLRPFYTHMTEIFGKNKILSADKKQWSVANGAAHIDITGGECFLNDDVCVLLSDDELYSILERGIAKVGFEQEPISFALTRDNPDAHFIFKNRNKRISYGMKTVQTKGFLQENLVLKSSIGKDQIARIIIENNAMGEGYSVSHSINKLSFYYNLSKINCTK